MNILTVQLDEYMLPCLNKTLLGIECMGCGLQRSILLILNGELIAAFYMYPAIYSLTLMFGFTVFNIFKKIKYFNKIITILAIITVSIIISNFAIKTFFN